MLFWSITFADKINYCRL